MVNRVPRDCYEQFGADLDGCSTQQNEGCGRCHLVKTCDNCLNYKDSRSDEKDSHCALCHDYSNFVESEQLVIIYQQRFSTIS